MSTTGAERRGAPRYGIIMEAHAIDLRSRCELKLQCSDISMSGCYLDTLNPMESGTPIWVRLRHGVRAFEAQARVAYHVPNLGMGVEFARPVPAEQLAILGEWIEEAAAHAKPYMAMPGVGA